MLGKILVTPVNLLLLDEPTNHLDMDACDALLAAIDNFNGSVVLVTHNEMFLHALAQRLIVLQDDRIEMFEGGYQHFLDKVGWRDEGLKTSRPPVQDQPAPARPRITKKERKRLRGELLNERSRVLKPLEKRLASVENKIEALEKKLAALNREMLEASHARDGIRIGELGKTIHSVQGEIDNCFEPLESITLTIERQQADFQKRLEALK